MNIDHDCEWTTIGFEHHKQYQGSLKPRLLHRELKSCAMCRADYEGEWEPCYCKEQI